MTQGPGKPNSLLYVIFGGIITIPFGLVTLIMIIAGLENGRTGLAIEFAVIFAVLIYAGIMLFKKGFTHPTANRRISHFL